MPGKFEGNYDQELAEHIYQLSLDGCNDDDFSDGEFWAGLRTFTDPVTNKDGTEYRGFVITEDSQGFVMVDGFTTAEKAQDYFDRMRDEVDWDEPEEISDSGTDLMTWADIARMEEE